MTAYFHHYLSILHITRLTEQIPYKTLKEEYKTITFWSSLFLWPNSATDFILLLTDQNNEAAWSEETTFISSANSAFKSLPVKM